MNETPVVSACAKAVIFGPSSSISRRVIDPVIDEMEAHGLIADWQYCDVAHLPPAERLDASVYFFLINNDHMRSAGARQAEHLAMRQAMDGDAVIIPVVLDPTVDFENSKLAFLTPVVATLDAQNVLSVDDENLEQVRARVSGFLDKKSFGAQQSAAQKIAERVAGISQIAESVDPLPCHMGAYDDFVEQLIARLQVMRMNDRRRNLNLFAEALRQVLGAEMVYCYFRGKNGDLHMYEADSNRNLHDCPATLVHTVLEEALAGYSQASARQSLRLQNFLPQLAPTGGRSSSIECMVIVNDRLPNCGVFIAAHEGFTRFPLTEVLSTVINTLHDALAWASFESFEKLKARVYDVLKETYRFVSTDMYEDRRRIFRNQLNGLNVHFEPMFSFDRTSREVDIFAYEALAREHLQSSAAPVEIFNSATLWGMGFQCELDSALLETTISAYGEQIKNSDLSAGCIKPLSLNVYPATLRSPIYRELLYEVLSRSAPLCGSNLIMEVSEKTVVSPELQTEARQQLVEYRDVVQQLSKLTGVRFAIDDFGVGNSSLSRLDSLKPDYVKIDRDVLSFDTRMADTLIRYLIESQREQGTRVILEGVDIHSKISLHELVNNIGVGLIQGHSLSKAVSNFDASWEKQVCHRVKSDLGWSSVLPNELQHGSPLVH